MIQATVLEKLKKKTLIHSLFLQVYFTSLLSTILDHISTFEVTNHLKTFLVLHTLGIFLKHFDKAENYQLNICTSPGIPTFATPNKKAKFAHYAKIMAMYQPTVV